VSLFEELKRRNVFRVGAAYLVFGWLLVQLVETILPAFGYGDGAVRNVVIVLGVLFFPVIVTAWAYELTADGFKRDHEIDQAGPGRSISPRILNALLAVLVAAAAGFFIFDLLVLDSKYIDLDSLANEESADNSRSGLRIESHSVAVLPFVSMSRGEDDEYFADGLTEEILNSLASLPELLVTARTSSFYFKGTDLPIPEIAATLGVSHVVEGSVRRSGDNVRTTAQLIRAKDGFHLWSKTYDRTLEDVFAVQEDIAHSIAEALNVILDDTAVSRMRDAGIGEVEAFIAYQKGNEAFAAAHSEMSTVSQQLEIANGYYDQVLQVAPHLLEARIRRTDRAGHVLFEIGGGLRTEAWTGEGQAALDELASEYLLGSESVRSEAEQQIIEVERLLFTEDWRSYGDKLDIALAGDDCLAGNWSYEVATHVGWADATVHRLRNNLRCDPLSGITRMSLVGALIWAGKVEEALKLLEESDVLGVAIPFRRTFNLVTMLTAGSFDENYDPRTPVPDGTLFSFDDRLLVEASSGEPAKARAMAAEFIESTGGGNWSSIVAAAAVGDRQAANAAASLIDALPGGPFMLLVTSQKCYCGAPFDLEFTPNFKARLDESGFNWPPASPIQYPLKNW
jgi:TolB-like protein